MSKLLHLAEMIIVLQYKNYVTASELSEILEVDKKTIYRYIETLTEANIPIETRKGRNGGFCLNGRFYMKEPRLNEKELSALILAADLLTKEKGFVYEHQLRSAVTKIKNVSGLKLETKFKLELVEGIDNLDDNLSKLNYAVENGRSVELNYLTVNRDAQKKLVVDPYNIIYRSAEWYLIGLDHNTENVQCFELRRISTISIASYLFIKPVNFSLDRFIKQSLGIFYGDKIRIIIGFSGKIKEFIESCRWHSSQEIKHSEDGVVFLTLYVDDLFEIKRWILSFGAAAEVIEPLQLRDEIAVELAKLRELYGAAQ